MTGGGGTGATAGVRASAGPTAPPTRSPGDPGRMIVTRGENDRHIRRAALLARWPVLGEQWALAIERIGEE